VKKDDVAIEAARHSVYLQTHTNASLQTHTQCVPAARLIIKNLSTRRKDSLEKARASRLQVPGLLSVRPKEARRICKPS
jgi:hypothetical protein